MSKHQVAIQQLLANTEGATYERINTILDSNGTLDDVQDYCKLLEHSIRTVRTQLAQDALIANIGDDTVCANYAVENPEYNACVGLLETCLKLVPNPMYRDDLRLRYYADILVPNPEVDYNIMRIALSNAVVKLNNGKPYAPVPVAVKEKKSWKRWIPSFSIA